MNIAILKQHFKIQKLFQWNNKYRFSYTLQKVYSFIQQNPQNIYSQQVIQYLDSEKSKNRFTIQSQFFKNHHTYESSIVFLTQLFVLNCPNHIQKELTKKSLLFFKHLSKLDVNQIILLNETLCSLLVNRESKEINQDDFFQYLQSNLKCLLNEGVMDLQIILSYLNSFIGILMLHKTQLKETESDQLIEQIFNCLQERVLDLLLKNSDELLKVKSFDPFLIELSKLDQKKTWKPKTGFDEFQIELRDELLDIDDLFRVMWIFFQQNQGSPLFYFSCLKQAFDKWSNDQRVLDFLFFLAYIDKTQCFDVESIYQTHLKQKQNVDQLIPLLFYSTVSFKDDPQITQNMVINLNQQLQNFEFKQDSFSLSKYTAMLMLDEIYKFEQPYLNRIQISNLCNHNIFENLFSDPFGEEVLNYLKENQFIYQQQLPIGLWKCPISFDSTRSLIIPFTKKFYLGNSQYQLFWANFIKRIMREYKYKLRIVDILDYCKFSKRSEKNNYLEHKFTGLQRKPQEKQQLYYNF